LILPTNKVQVKRLKNHFNSAKQMPNLVNDIASCNFISSICQQGGQQL